MTESRPVPRDEIVLSCKALEIGWEGRALLPPIDLEMRRGRILAVVGRNGAGKTTWFKTVLGLIPPVRGTVHRASGARLSYVPQTPSLEPMLPVRARDVVAWGLLTGRRFFGPVWSRRDRDACLRALDDAGARDLADRPFRELSKGQRQRVLFARMLVSEPDLALLDEPTAAMDVAAERDALRRIEELRDRGVAVVVVSHAPDFARRVADSILLLDRASGEVVHGTRAEVIAQAAFSRHFRAAEAADG